MNIRPWVKGYRIGPGRTGLKDYHNGLMPDEFVIRLIGSFTWQASLLSEPHQAEYANYQNIVEYLN